LKKSVSLIANNLSCRFGRTHRSTLEMKGGESDLSTVERRNLKIMMGKLKEVTAHAD